mmetsp:Transcript_5761/g.12830  ORF Transcript_5761/g.12830 Transcript_5761/m.12830 type:complete len:136 (-) Transcript_5761:239-646(-)
MAGLVHTSPVPMTQTTFGCFEDVGDCVYGACCGACHLGSVAQKSQSGDCCTTCLVGTCLSFPLIYNMYAKGVLQSALQRVGVTQEIGLFECLCCIGCVQCQVSREIMNRQSQMATGGGTAAPQVVVVHAPKPQTM